MSASGAPSTRKTRDRAIRPRYNAGRVRSEMKSAIQWILFGSVAVATMSVQAQRAVPARRSWTPTRTASGAPDIQGVWNYGTMTPLERPAQWAEKEVLTQEEADAY